MTETISRPPAHSGLAFGTWTVIRNPRFREWSSEAQPDGYPDRITFSEGVDGDRGVDQVEHGSIDVLLWPPTSRLHELQTRYTAQLHSDPATATNALVLNTRVAPFDRLSVRRALNYAIDRNRIVGLAGGSLLARTTCQILPPTVRGFRPYCPYTNSPNPSGTWTAPNLAAAQQLVRTSGTRGTKVTVLVPPYDPATSVGRYTVSVLNRLGYKASLRVSPDQYSFVADSRNHAQIAWLGWIQDLPAPSNAIDPLLRCSSFKAASTGNLNWAEFCAPAIDADMERAGALQALSPGVASEKWAQIDTALTDQAPWVPLYNPRTITATSARVGNYQYHPLSTLLLDQLWVR